MSAYHRLISYIYAYEGGIKGKNTGFAKLETRGTSCRIQVSVRRIFAGGSPVGVYLLAGQDEIRIGTLFVRGGNGEFRTVVSCENVEGSGCSMEECCGLTIHETDSAWRAYTTIWEDAVAHAAEVELEDVTAGNVREQETKKKETTQKLENAAGGDEKTLVEELKDEEKVTAETVEIEENGRSAENTETEENGKSAENTEPGENRTVSKEVKSEENRTSGESAEPKEDKTVPEERKSDKMLTGETETKTEKADAEKVDAVSGNEKREALAEELWNHLRATYPKVSAFECSDGCEVLVIKPQDIGLLPRENWVYGNNSFLLHGYYNYRYLILARLGKTGGPGRYILGVPGHYGNNEKYMAAMFGFNRFIRSSRQPPRDGRFGYWYTELNFT